MGGPADEKLGTATAATFAPLLWLRLELLEHGTLQFPSRYNLRLTYENIQSLIRSLSSDKEVSFETWMEAANATFGWHKVESTTFWNICSFFHKQQHLKRKNVKPDKDTSNTSIPLTSVAIFLFLHTDTQHHFKTKEELEEFNAVWSQRHDNTIKKSLSPHEVGLKEKARASVHHTAFIKANLKKIMSCIFSTTLTLGDLKSLDFLFAGGPSLAVESMGIADLYDSKGSCFSREEVSEWITTHLVTNEYQYPSIGEDLEKLDDYANSSLLRPKILCSITKTSVIEHGDDDGTDLLIYNCHDVYLYLLQPFRYVTVIACSNATIVTGPVSCVMTVDRCERVNVSIIASVVRITNCLESCFNTFHTSSSSAIPLPPIVTGDNRGITIGPYNTMYSALERHLRRSGKEHYCWEDVALNVSFTSFKPEEVEVQPPSLFKVLVVPEEKTHDEKDLLLPIPSRYGNVLRERKSSEMRLRQELLSLISEEGNENTDPSDTAQHQLLETILQSHFKEWLTTSGNIRQVQDLVHLASTSVSK